MTLSPVLAVGKANVLASFGRYLQEHIPEETFLFDEPADAIFSSSAVAAVVGVNEIPLPYGTDVEGFAAGIAGDTTQGQWEGTQFNLEIVVDQQKEPSAPLRIRMIRDKLLYLLRAAGRMDDTGPNELQVKPPIFIFNLANDKSVDTSDPTTNAVGQIFLPWAEDGWIQEFDETDPETPKLKRYRLVVRAYYFTRFDQTFTPSALKPN